MQPFQHPDLFSSLYNASGNAGNSGFSLHFLDRCDLSNPRNADRGSIQRLKMLRLPCSRSLLTIITPLKQEQ